jgi:hypothetical protein
MQAHERVGAVPVSARAVTSFYHHDVGLALRDQRVGESHPRRATAYYQVVRLDGCHQVMLLAGRPPSP